MPQQTKTFRVFVSSTSTNMKELRMILKKEVLQDDFMKVHFFYQEESFKPVSD